MNRTVLLPPPRRLLAGAAALIGLSLAVGLYLRSPTSPQPLPPTLTADGPPWTLGSPQARHTLVVYADLECPFCKTYVPHLMQWVGTQADVALQWQHLPLPAHEPAATAQARMAECAGQVHGAAAFWDTIQYLYQHTRGNGDGLPDGQQPPTTATPALQACLDSEHPDSLIRAQAEQAIVAGITGTPVLQLHDRDTGRMLTLEGVVDDDVLLSALDWLASADDAGDSLGTASEHLPEMPANVVGDMPR